MSALVQAFAKIKAAAQSAWPSSGPPGSQMKVKVRLEAWSPPDKDGVRHLEGVREKKKDLATKQFAMLIQLNILNTGETIRDTSNATHAESANTACTVPTISAGTSGTAAAFADFALGTETETVGAAVNSISGSAFTVTGTVTAGANRAYQEVGLKVTCNTHIYLICHDTFSTLNVSNGGTLAVTYTITFS